MTTDTKVFDVPDVIRALRQVVAAKGADYVYPVSERSNGEEHGACMYKVPAGGGFVPSCIVGQVIHHLGLPLPVENGGAYSILKVEYPHNFDDAEEAGAVLVLAQRTQDGQWMDGDWQVRPKSWGEALKAAEGKARELGYEVD